MQHILISDGGLGADQNFSCRPPHQPAKAANRSNNGPGKPGTGCADAACGVKVTAAESVLVPLAFTAFSLTVAADPLVNPDIVMGLAPSAGVSAV